ncbi:FAD-binding oxidoreductase [Aspergillus brunneoviolaceus CBS 621.78]|uniref:FAD-binding domain-containing protein n=1 Tax=Aspergillus brunneoviolaceus CBS 621.78 TaxID=1450534 RepID=A0ACD1FZB5_9EURO|nr:FAD-binding domain-containing protein [Aspergillus brunneoviolaceus CBS 621.78]RAH42321.1 FAD-binding domain-containing protein [Aspergillus brunneoviolaceus CBS 621.78]
MALASTTRTASASTAGKLNFYTPAWAGWDEHVVRWSSYKAPTFSAVFLPETEEELSEGIAHLAKHRIPYLATKIAGHGNSPTLGTYQDVIQVNLKHFRNITINPENTVTVGGGAKWEDLIPRLRSAGRELTVGSFPCVGVHGVMLGGGMGRLMGTYGLTSDGLLRMKVALWNGTIVEASDEALSDLFWAMRGAGHNFGVAIESTLQTWPDQGGLHYNADMVFTDESLAGVLTVANRLIRKGLDPAVGLVIGYLYNLELDKPVLMVNIVYAHDEEAGRKLVAQFSSTTTETERPISRVFLNETVLTFAELGSGDALPSVCRTDQYQNLYTASSPTTFDVDAMIEVYDSYGRFLREHPAANASILLFETTSRHRIDAFPDDHTAYPHRGRLGTNAIIQMTWKNDRISAAVDRWAKGARDSLAAPAVSGDQRPHVYINYANADEPPAAVYSYDPIRQARLSALKRKYDPYGFFNAYHPIPLHPGQWNLLREGGWWSIPPFPRACPGQ